MPSPLTCIFVIAVVANASVQWWLSVRQVRAVHAHRDRVPAPFVATVPLTAHRQAADYTAAREHLGRVELVIDAVLLLMLTVGGGIAALDTLIGSSAFPQPWHGAAVILAVLFLQMLVGLPIAWYRTFQLDARFDFNRMTPTIFVADVLKQAVLTLILGLPLLATILCLMARAGQIGWLYAWVVFALFVVILQWAYPACIAPWFNRFTPLADQVLLARVEALLARCGFESRGVFVMNGSLRSTQGNAYFTGFGRTKRVVFFDTVLERLTIDELESVLAHELGHFRNHHTRSRLIVVLLMSFIGFVMLGWLANQPEFYRALGVPLASAHSALLLFMLASQPVFFWLSPLGAWWSRQHEYQADEFAARHISAKSLASALSKLYRDNASTLTPDPVHSAVYDSHPPALLRITRLQRLAHG